MSTITPSHRIRELLLTYRHTHHEVARLLAVPLAEVKRIARSVPKIYPDETRPPKRCPQCGAKVHMPCLACKVRELAGE